MHRFADIDPSFKRLTPIYGYRSQPLVSIEQALTPLHSHIDELPYYVKIAKQHCHHPCEHGLTRDESASIYIYTMEWGDQTLYRVLNRALRDEDRQVLLIWFPYLKLFMTALEKLPKVKGNLWRGVPGSMGKKFTRDLVFTWWSMNSCSTSVSVINGFLGKEERSTEFLIEASSGREISKYSNLQNEEEVILPMGTQFRVKGDPLVRPKGQDVVHLVEIEDETPTASATGHAQLTTTVIVKKPSKLRANKWNRHGTTVAGGHGQGEQLDQLSRPCSIFVDENKAILISDRRNHRIVLWKYGASKGTILAGGHGQGHRIDQLNEPKDVLVDRRDQSIIIADWGNRRVVRWFPDTAAKPQVLMENINVARLAMDDKQRLYVSDHDKHEVRRWEADGQWKAVAGGHGEGSRLDQLCWPRFLFIDNERSIYLSDNNNHRVVKWKRGANEGIVVAGGNGQGHKLNQLSYPQGILVDQWGHVYVADSWNGRVMRWREGANEGEVVVGGNGEGQDPNQLSSPHGLAFDNEGNLYVADCRNQRVQRFNLA